MSDGSAEQLYRRLGGSLTKTYKWWRSYYHNVDYQIVIGSLRKVDDIV